MATGMNPDIRFNFVPYNETATAITYEVQGSGDLVMWEDLTTNQGELGDVVIVTVTLSDSSDRSFIRLRVYR